jgi:hypothetical protein
MVLCIPVEITVFELEDVLSGRKWARSSQNKYRSCIHGCSGERFRPTIRAETIPKEKQYETENPLDPLLHALLCEFHVWASRSVP